MAQPSNEYISWNSFLKRESVASQAKEGEVFAAAYLSELLEIEVSARP
jgi:hypothetical protein